MPPRSPRVIPASQLLQYPRPQRPQQPQQQQQSAANNGPLRVAVLGGGISGLSAAYRLSQEPNIQVTLYEKAPTPGGWLQSERVDVKKKKNGGAGGGSVLFEWGARNLRVGSKSCQPTIDLVRTFFSPSGSWIYGPDFISYFDAVNMAD